MLLLTRCPYQYKVNTFKWCKKSEWSKATGKVRLQGGPHKYKVKHIRSYNKSKGSQTVRRNERRGYSWLRRGNIR